MAITGKRTENSTTFATADDEMSLATAQARQASGATPDTLEVRSDALAILQGSMEPMRRTVLVAGTVGVAALVIVLATMSWMRRSSLAATT